MDDLYIHSFFRNANWRAVERLEVRPPFIPIDCCPALAKTTLLAHERITPGFSTPFFIDQFSEYTYIKPNFTVPMMAPPVAVATPVTIPPALTLACTGNEPSPPSCPAWSLLHQSLLSEQPPAVSAKQVKDDTLLRLNSQRRFNIIINLCSNLFKTVNIEKVGRNQNTSDGFLA